MYQQTTGDEIKSSPDLESIQFLERLEFRPETKNSKLAL